MPLFRPSSTASIVLALRRRDPGLLLIVGMLACIGLFGLWRLFDWGGDANRSLIGNLAYLPLCLVPLVLCWRTAARPHPNRRVRLAWLMLTLAAACELAGNAIWAYLENGLGLHLTLCDYLAGRTDRCPGQEHLRLFDPEQRV